MVRGWFGSASSFLTLVFLAGACLGGAPARCQGDEVTAQPGDGVTNRPGDEVTKTSGEELDYHVTDPDLKVVRLDTSPDDSFLSVRTDSTGRIFVGGRRNLFAYDLDAEGRYKPRVLLYEFPDHTWLNDIEVRGDDLYVVTVSAVYRIPGGRVNRSGLKPERLLWGVPNGHVHQCLHACAWGPEGDLYVSMGDPLWYYGDFTRPDHWGHWTMFFRRSPTEGTAAKAAARTLNRSQTPATETSRTHDTEFHQKWDSMPYNGVGAIFRIRPDGTHLQSFARGLRNPCGLCFDKDGNLFTNDNDHEGIPSQFAPGRLMHVTPDSYWSWPRGWMQSKTPDRADILPMVNNEMGRAVPVLQTYYADGYLPDKYHHSLLVARWCRRTVSYFPLEQQGETFTATEKILLEGRDQARPVGVCVGRGGRVFVTLCYMAQNEGSPTYRSDLAVITRKDDPEQMPFDPYDTTSASEEKLLAELNNPAHWRSSTARQELLRRKVTVPSANRITERSPAKKSANSLASLLSPRADQQSAGKKTRGEGEELLKSIEREPHAYLQRRREGKYHHFTSATDLNAADAVPNQADPLALARFPLPNLTAELCHAPETVLRMAGVLTAGFRLTIPPVDAPLSPAAPLAPQQKEEANIILYADEPAPIDLRTLGRVGNYTTAEHWNALPHTPEQERLFALLVERLHDDNDRIRLQAAHFLSLLNDPRSEPQIARVVSGVQDRRLDVAKLEHVKPEIWTLGPIPDADGFPKTVHPVETTAIDLSSPLTIAGKEYEWKKTKPTSPDRPLYDFNLLFGPSPNSSVYSLFRFESPTAKRMQLLVGSEDGVKVWQNGKLIHENDIVRPLIQLDDVVPLDLEPGSNDILVRVGMRQGIGGQYLHFRHLGDVRFSLPEKPDGLSLAERLKSQTEGGTQAALDPKFVQYDWAEEIKQGDPVRGRKLFGAESLGCVKCHAVTASQAGGGGPSLADAGKRFTLPYLVESVLVPSKNISPVFRSTVVTTHEGKVITGLVVSETGEKVEVLLPDTKRITVEKTQIDERQFGEASAMPLGLVKTPEELRDVLAYLLSNPTE
ncbi:hypothetical protein [Schlesneria sp. T3-172]|uniref:hypothetical protein n=1 Tax=Schlesneria sphaerica TaxID=3373610 RepID=UPI0037C8F5C6